MSEEQKYTGLSRRWKEYEKKNSSSHPFSHSSRNISPIHLRGTGLYRRHSTEYRDKQPDRRPYDRHSKLHKQFTGIQHHNNICKRYILAGLQQHLGQLLNKCQRKPKLYRQAVQQCQPMLRERNQCHAPAVPCRNKQPQCHPERHSKLKTHT